MNIQFWMDTILLVISIIILILISVVFINFCKFVIRYLNSKLMQKENKKQLKYR